MRAGESSTVDDSIIHEHWSHGPPGLLKGLYLSLSVVRAVPTGPSVWPPLTISTIGQCSRQSYSGLDRRWMGASVPAHSHMKLMQGATRRWSRGEVICENTLVEHKNAVCPWDIPPSTGLRWQLKFAEPAKDLDGKLFRNTIGQAKMHLYISVWLREHYYESLVVGP